MTFMERRIRLADLMAQAAELIRGEPDPDNRALLIERCADELQDCLENDCTYSAALLGDVFVQSVEAALARVKAEPEPRSLDANRVDAPPVLRVVK